jgi:hypothetical protein
LRIRKPSEEEGYQPQKWDSFSSQGCYPFGL